MPTERIHARVSQLRRRTAMRATAAVATGAIVVALIVGVLPTGAARGRVHVATATTVAHRRGRNVPTTARTSVTTTTVAGHSPASVPPATAPDSVPNSVPVATPTTRGPVVASPTTAARSTPSSQPSSPSSPTTVAPAPAPVTVTLILDNAGLHVSPTQIAAGTVTIIFRDQRTDKSNGYGGTLVPEVHVTPADAGYASSIISRPWYDEDCCGHFGAAVGYSHLAGAVSFQVFDRNNHGSAGPLVWTTFAPS
jgi:hypothetical protein